MYQSLTLKNGIRVILVPHADTKAVTVQAFFPVGSRYEHKKINGISHFIEHLMFKGTPRRPTTLDLTQALDSNGAEYNAFTGKDTTSYYIKIDAEKSRVALDILSDMLFHSKFEAKEIDRERGVIVEELHMYADNPAMYIEDIFEETLYGDHPLGWRIGGFPEIIKTVSRAEILKHRDLFYEPQHMVLAVAGKLRDETLNDIEATFGQAPVGRVPRRRVEKWTKLGSGRVRLEYRETDQVQVALGAPSYPYEDKRLAALRVVNVILGGTMSSRLFISVRERLGLAYRINSQVEQYHDAGNWSVRAGLDKGRVEKAIVVIMAELKKLKTRGVTKKELADAKQNVRGRMILNLEESSELADFFGKQALLLSKIKTPDEIFADIEAVTLKDAQMVARELLDNKKFRMAVIGPFKDAAAFEKLLRL